MQSWKFVGVPPMKTVSHRLWLKSNDGRSYNHCAMEGVVYRDVITRSTLKLHKYLLFKEERHSKMIEETRNLLDFESASIPVSMQDRSVRNLY